MPALPTIDDCQAAARTLEGRIHRTPVFSSRSLAERIGRPVHLKAELFQRTGSFKLRGATNRVAAMGRSTRLAVDVGQSVPSGRAADVWLDGISDRAR